jgi:hypothetical protein
LRSAEIQSARETAVWALAILSCNDEWHVVPQVWEQNGASVLCEVLHQKRWKCSSRCIQYAATVIQLTIETMQGHLLRVETIQYVGTLLSMMESSDVSIKEWGANTIVTLVNKSADETVPLSLCACSLFGLPLSFVLSLTFRHRSRACARCLFL